MQTWPALRYFAAARIFAADDDVGVLEHDRRRVAAELHGGALHVQAGQRGELLAHMVEPVKEILRITGCGMRYSEISDGTP